MGVECFGSYIQGNWDLGETSGHPQTRDSQVRCGDTPLRGTLQGIFIRGDNDSGNETSAN